MPKLHPRAFYLFWWKFFWTFLVITIIPLIVISAVLSLIISFESFLFYVAIGLFLDLILSGVWAKLFYNSYSFELAKQSLNVKWGVVIKHSATIPYSRIQNIDINRGIMARLLGLSEIWVQTAGASVGVSTFGSLRATEGLVPGLAIGDAEKFRSALLKKVKGKSGL